MIQIKGTNHPILSQGALSFLTELHKKFDSQRKELLINRILKQRALDNGELPSFLKETIEIREAQWQVAPCPKDLNDRRVEIIGPAETNTIIEAMNSGAKVYMADFEDFLSPTWANILNGQESLRQAVLRKIQFTDNFGNTKKLNDNTATLMVRTRGWHLAEKHVHIDGEPLSASLFDFGIYFYHNAKQLLEHGTGPYFYLPKLENHFEARLWNNIFIFAQEFLNIPRGSIRATVLIETILAAFEMEEILFELREHITAMNTGRWDYLFSMIKKFKNHPFMNLPDRTQITMRVPFMKAYADLLVKTCHKRGAHAIGGLSGYLPSDDTDATRVASEKVHQEKVLEVNSGFDGTWVASPVFVPLVLNVFHSTLGLKPHQMDRRFDDIHISPEKLLMTDIPGSNMSEAGVRYNIQTALQYLDKWLSGQGAVTINNLMEDVATAEISRSQIWIWIKQQVKLADGTTMSLVLYKKILSEEVKILKSKNMGRLEEAVEIFNSFIMDKELKDFFTTSAYNFLE